MCIISKLIKHMNIKVSTESFSLNFNMDVRLGKYKQFNPTNSKWGHDKQVFETATKGLEVLVAKNFSQHAIPCVAIYPDMDMKSGLYRGFNVAAPDGPLRSYFEQEDTKKIFFSLLREATIDSLAKKNRMKEGEEVTAACSITKTTGVTKPPRPVYALGLKEAETYFSILKSEIAKDENVKLKPKWPKIVNDKVVKLPTSIPSFDDVVEQILPSSVYRPYQKFPPGNLHWRLKLVLDYLFKKKNLDPNSFAEEIPEEYEPKIFDVKKLVEYSQNIERSAEEHHKKKKKEKDNNEAYVPFGLEDDGANYDTEDSADDNDDQAAADEVDSVTDAIELEEENVIALPPYSPMPAPAQSPAPALSPTPAPTRATAPLEASTTGTLKGQAEPSCSSSWSPAAAASSSRTLPLISILQKKKQSKSKTYTVTLPVVAEMFHDLDENDELFNTSHSTGTPENSTHGAVEPESVDGEEEEQMAMLEEEMEDIDHYQHMLRDTDIRKILSGNEELNQPILQGFQFEKLRNGKCFRSHGHDSKVTTTKITFSADINEKVELLLNKMPIIRVTNFILYNGSFLFIKDFEMIKMLERKIADPDYIVQQEYEDLKLISKPNSNLPQTPTMAIRKLSDKNVDKTNKSSSRSSSHRIRKKNQGSS